MKMCLKKELIVAHTTSHQIVNKINTIALFKKICCLSKVENLLAEWSYQIFRKILILFQQIQKVITRGPNSILGQGNYIRAQECFDSCNNLGPVILSANSFRRILESNVQCCRSSVFGLPLFVRSGAVQEDIVNNISKVFVRQPFAEGP